MAEVPNLKQYLQRIASQPSGSETVPFWLDPMGTGASTEVQVSLEGGMSVNEFYVRDGLAMQIDTRMTELKNANAELSDYDARQQAQDEVLVGAVFNWLAIIQMMANNSSTQLLTLEGRIEDLEATLTGP